MRGAARRVAEAIEFSELQDDFARLGASVFGASRVLQDKEVGGVVREGAVRSTFIIDKQGVIRHALYGVSSRGHAAEMLQLVKELN